MKNFLLFFFLITLVVTCKAGDDDDDDGDCDDKTCPKGEIYRKDGPCNQPNCDDKNPHNDKCCKGCFCPKGFIRKYKGGPCIREDDCPKCPKGEIYKTDGPCNQPNCDDKNPHNDKCCKGCFCPKGYIRQHKDGPCIREDDCPKCPKGEIYKIDGLCNQPNCDDKNPHNDKCCKGCFCPKGYIRQHKDGPCIREDDCPKCPKGEIYKIDGPCNQPNCDDKNPHNDECCKGCFCPKGFIRKYKGGPCIREDDCPKCPKGEIWNNCGPSPQPDCDNRDLCDEKCEPGCFCPKGYIRKNKGGPCIKICDCPESEEDD